MENEVKASSEVGIEVMSGDEGEAIAAAIEKDNAGSRVTRFIGFLRITVPHKLILNKVSVESFLGREWNTQDFQQVLANYFGILTKWDDECIVIQWTREKKSGGIEV